jgi:hypothetical protein
MRNFLSLSPSESYVKVSDRIALTLYVSVLVLDTDEVIEMASVS